MRSWQEGFDAEDIDDHTTLRAALDVTTYHFVLFEGFVDTIPATSDTSLAVRKHELSLLVFLRLDEDLNLVSDLKLRIVAELRCIDCAFALESNIDKYFTLADLGDRTDDYFLILDVRQRAVVRSFLLLTGSRACYFSLLKLIPIEVGDGLDLFQIFHLLNLL